MDDHRDEQTVRRSTIVRRVAFTEPRVLRHRLLGHFEPVRPASTGMIVQRPETRRRGPFVLMFFEGANNQLTTWCDTLQLALDAAAEVAGVRAEDWQVGSEPFGSAPTISTELLQQLARIPPSTNGAIEYRPSRVRLRDNSWRDAVYLQDLETYIDEWICTPGGDRAGYEIDFGDVVAMADSAQRLPLHIANALYEAGESAMGGCYFTLVTRSGMRIPCLTGNLVDFIDLPNGVTPTDIVGVEPHAEDARTASNPATTPDIRWSVYSLPA